MSVKITIVETEMPPAPTPWTARPTRNWVTALEVQQIIVPAVKSSRHARSKLRRPKMSESAARKG